MRKTLTRRLSRLALRFASIPRRAPFSPDIELVGNSDRLLADLFKSERATLGASGDGPVVLDVGGRRGERADLFGGYRYEALDIIPRADHVRVGDICDCPEIADNSYDVVSSFDVFEHVERPWDAAAECVRITRPGGLLIHRTLFAYRYHPNPIDYWRFTAQGLEYLFCRGGGVETVIKGYDIRGRRRNRIGMMKDRRDVPPIDLLGGFRENWLVLFVGRVR